MEEIEEIHQITLESSEEGKEMKKDTTILAPYMGELLVLQRILHAIEGLRKESQREYIFHS